ncbi:MAG: DUF2232 domain-containing protein [Syntrophales bacterium]|nr:DUF2232 domain-containing protein [Syntrophales bacterium]
MVITEFFFALALTVAVFVAVAFISVSVPAGALASPLPVLYFYSRMGRVRGLIFFAIVLLVLSWLLESIGAPVTSSVFLVFGSLGLILSELLRRELSIEKTIAFATVALLVMVFVAMSYHGIISGRKPWVLAQEQVVRTVRENIDYYADTGVSADKIEMVRERESELTALMSALMPSLIITGCAFIVWLNIIAGSILFRKRNMWYPAFGDLSRWKLPERLVWAVAVAFICLLLPLRGLVLTGLNGIIILSFLYMLQGFAIMAHFFKVKKIPPFIKIALYAIVLMQQLLLLPVALLGLIDVWADFRKMGHIRGGEEMEA